MTFFESLEASRVAEWVAASIWGYPITLTAHSVGLSIVVGILFVLNLRLLGLLKGIPLDALRSLLKVALAGFLLNVVSGLALFSSQATYFITHPAFLVKISAIILASLDAVLIQRLLRKHGADWGAGTAVPSGTRLLALASLLLWLGAITAGRLIAYV